MNCNDLRRIREKAEAYLRVHPPKGPANFNRRRDYQDTFYPTSNVK